MESLNDIIKRHIEGYERIFEHYKINASFELDQNLPEIYEDFSYGTPLHNALAQLTGEATDVKPSKILYKTKYEGNTQILMILHNGNKIPEDKLKDMNDFLINIAEGRIEWEGFRRHGNRIAAQHIKVYGGRIHLENVDDSEYNVETTVEIPINI